VILLIGYIVARVIAGVVRRAMQAAGADRALETGKAGDYRQQFAPSLHASAVVSAIAFWFVFGAAILLAISTLGIEALQSTVASVVGYLPNVVAAVLIMLVAVALAGAVGGLASRLAPGTMLGKLIQTVVPVLVITIALFMALVQLKIATQIVVATYVLVLGAICLGFAIAFGLGGRDVAARMLGAAYESGQEAMPRLKQDAMEAKERAADDVDRIKERADLPASSSPSAPGA